MIYSQAGHEWTAKCAWLQVGADDEGYAVRMKLKHYMEYVHSEEHARADDSPLYIFDGTFASRRGSRSMRREYSVPPYFREDLMSLAGERRRPPYRLFTPPAAVASTWISTDSDAMLSN